MNGDFYVGLVLGKTLTPGLKLRQFLEHLSKCNVLAQCCVVYCARHGICARWGIAEQDTWKSYKVKHVTREENPLYKATESVDVSGINVLSRTMLHKLTRTNVNAKELTHPFCKLTVHRESKKKKVSVSMSPCLRRLTSRV